MSTKPPSRELPDGKVWVPSCPECTAITETWHWLNWCPLRGGVHKAGQLMLRQDTFHEADCPLLAGLEPGFVAAPTECKLCEDCIPMLWWDVLPGNKDRLEIRHADDCCAAQSVAAGTVSVSMT
jgi:hypothetical protein